MERLDGRGMTCYRVEKDLGYSAGYISRMVRKGIKPNRKLAIELRNHFGVPVDAWDQPAEGSAA